MCHLIDMSSSGGGVTKVCLFSDNDYKKSTRLKYNKTRKIKTTQAHNGNKLP